MKKNLERAIHLAMASMICEKKRLISNICDAVEAYHYQKYHNHYYVDLSGDKSQKKWGCDCGGESENMCDCNSTSPNKCPICGRYVTEGSHHHHSHHQFDQNEGNMSCQGGGMGKMIMGQLETINKKIEEINNAIDKHLIEQGVEGTGSNNIATETGEN